MMQEMEILVCLVEMEIVIGVVMLYFFIFTGKGKLHNSGE